MMEREDIDRLIAEDHKIASVESSSLPEGWWDRSTFDQQGVVDVGCLLVVPSASEESIRRDVFRLMLELPAGRRVRVMSPPLGALLWFVLLWNKRSLFGHAFKVASDHASVEWTDSQGVTKLAIPILFLIYKAEMGSPGFW